MLTARAAALCAVCVLAIPGVLLGADPSSRGSLRYRDFEDMVRCRFILQEVCARLKAGDRSGADAFAAAGVFPYFGALPGDQGRIVSCRRGVPSKDMRQARKQPQLSLLLGYESKSTQEIGLRFGRLGLWTCGFISEIGIGPRRYEKDGRRLLDFGIRWNENPDGSVEIVEGGDAGPHSRDDLVARVRPEADDSPRSAYIEKVLREIRGVRERAEAARAPVSRPRGQNE